MLKKKCIGCGEKVERKFNYCPYCGNSFKARDERADFGMLGQDDSSGRIADEIKLPFGVEKIMNSLVKQLEKQLDGMNIENAQKMPKGIKIQIARGMPQMGQPIQKTQQQKPMPQKISNEEMERRMSLPKTEAESKIRRLANTIIYEIETPGVKNKEDVLITELASGLEIKAYSKNKCYVKFIPLKVEVTEYYVKKEKVFIELKG
jgi:HSP20 family molecular chaperone IbpA